MLSGVVAQQNAMTPYHTAMPQIHLANVNHTMGMVPPIIPNGNAVNMFAAQATNTGLTLPPPATAPPRTKCARCGKEAGEHLSETQLCTHALNARKRSSMRGSDTWIACSNELDRRGSGGNKPNVQHDRSSSNNDTRRGGNFQQGKLRSPARSRRDTSPPRRNTYSGYNRDAKDRRGRSRSNERNVSWIDRRRTRSPPARRTRSKTPERTKRDDNKELTKVFTAFSTQVTNALSKIEQSTTAAASAKTSTVPSYTFAQHPIQYSAPAPLQYSAPPQYAMAATMPTCVDGNTRCINTSAPMPLQTVAPPPYSYPYAQQPYAQQPQPYVQQHAAPSHIGAPHQTTPAPYYQPQQQQQQQPASWSAAPAAFERKTEGERA